MSCRSWWCGGAPVELAAAPAGTALWLACGCAVTREGGRDPDVPVAFARTACDAHRASSPSRLPPDTPVLIDLFATMLGEQ